LSLSNHGGSTAVSFTSKYQVKARSIMRALTFTLVVLGAAILFVVLGNNDFVHAQVVATQGADLASPSFLSPTATPSFDWVILPTMPASATQAEVGAELYRLACSQCHGDQGQGLTDEWRATWPADHQNCWQAKCHGTSHPSDGFQIPRYVPAIIGPNTLAQFKTALQLYDYNRTSMPWPTPGGLVDEKNWEVTAFLIQANAIDPIQVPLDSERAAQLQLHTVKPTNTATPHSSSTAASQPTADKIAADGSGAGAIALVGVLCAAVILGLWYRRNH
jgi:hypothetical protein